MITQTCYYYDYYYILDRKTVDRVLIEHTMRNRREQSVRVIYTQRDTYTHIKRKQIVVQGTCVPIFYTSILCVHCEKSNVHGETRLFLHTIFGRGFESELTDFVVPGNVIFIV